MKSRLLALLLLAAAAVVGFTSEGASADNSLLFGQKQAYTSIVRSDQKVVTYAKFVYNNPDTNAFSKSSFTIPDGVKVSNVTAYQILPPSKCSGEASEAEQEDDSQARYAYQPSCASIKDDIFTIDSYGYYYYGSSEANLRYKPIDLKQQGSGYSFSFPEPIASQERGAILVSYIAPEGYVSGNFGLYHLKFKTLQVPQSIEEVRVAVDVSSDFYTRAKQSSIETSSLEDGISTGASAADSSGALKSTSLDKLQSSIGQGGEFTKTGKSLMPDETFVVEGDFADAAWKLNIGWIIGGSIGLIVLIALSIILMKKANSVHANPTIGKKGKK